MPKRRNHLAKAFNKCTVVGCCSEWITMSRNRHTFCEQHMIEANDLYHMYKEANKEALITFSDHKLRETIELREKYSLEYLDYEDKGSHKTYIEVLSKVLSVPWHTREKTYQKLMQQYFLSKT